MKFTVVVAVSTVLVLAACQSVTAPGPATPATGNHMLLDSGFVKKRANTAKQAAAMRRLPANVMVKQTVKGKPTYLYADPDGCNCVYVGDDAALQNYRGMQNTMFDMTQAQPGGMGMSDPGLSPANIDDLDSWSPM